MTMRSRQSGMTMISWAALIALIGFVGMFGFKLMPIYMEYSSINSALTTAAKDAVSGMIDLLTFRHKISPVHAYMLCSVAGDLRISEIVDIPNWVVSFYFPRVVFE